MADSKDPLRPSSQPEPLDPEVAAYQEEAPEVGEDTPRREASARFVVEADVGADAALRDAMDPANQSLAEALHLSYRVLQVVILVLVVMFLASGFRTVDDGQSGVLTVWGKIVTVDDEHALSPGAKFTLYPYPVGEFIVFDVENRSVDLSSAFAPASRGRTRQEMLEQASARDALRPGRDGFLLTRDGDLAHLEMAAKYIIDQPVEFVERINDADASRNANAIVTRALQSAAIHVASGLSLTELTEVDYAEDLRQRIQQRAQEVLNGLGCGIQIAQVQINRSYPPLAVESTTGELHENRLSAANRIQNALRRYEETMNEVAGANHGKLIHLIEQYEDAVDRGDEPLSSELLDSINAMLESDEITGDVAHIIQFAHAYQSQVESTLGNEYRRYASLLRAFRENPQLVVKQQWLETYAKVMSRKDTEIFTSHPGMKYQLILTGSSAIQDLRRQNDVDRRTREAEAMEMDPTRHLLRGRHMTEFRDQPGRQLEQDAKGRLRPVGAEDEP